MVRAFLVLVHWVSWKVGKGDRVPVGQDPQVDATENYCLSEELRLHLRELGIIKLVGVGVPKWFASSLDLSGRSWFEWVFVSRMEGLHSISIPLCILSE